MQVVIVAAALLATSEATAWSLFGSAPDLDDFDRVVFVPSRAEPKVAAIDSDSDEVIATLELPWTPSQVLVSDAAALLIAANAERHELALIDLADPRPAVTLKLDVSPDHMQLGPDGYMLAVGDIEAGTVLLISLANRAVQARIDGFAAPWNLTFSLEGSQLYVADLERREIGVVSVERGELVDPIAIESPDAVGVNNVTGTPSGRFGFATLEGSPALAVLDLNSGRQVASLETGARPWRTFGTADGRLILAPSNESGEVAVVDAGAQEVVATLPGARGVVAINTGWFDSMAFIVSEEERRVVVLNLIDMTKLRDIDLPGKPGPGVVTPDGAKLYIALADLGAVAVIDARRGEFLTLIEGVGAQPYGAVMGRSNNYCH